MTAADLLSLQPAPVTGPDPRAPLRQLLPLHRLSRHRRRRRGHRGQAQRKGRVMNEIIDPRSVDRPNSYIGKSVPRPNAKKLVEGRGQYVDDVVLPRMVHVAFVRSPHAHAKILAIDGSEALKMPGVLRVFYRARSGRPLRAVGRHAGAPQGHEVCARSFPCRSSAPPGSARRSPPSWRKAAPRPRMPSRMSASTTSRSRPWSTWKPRSCPPRR